jgi:DNA-binding NarL/FixJ family response regulator
MPDSGERKGLPTQEEEPKTNRPIRVLLADDHTLFRQGLAGLLASYGGLEIVSEVPNDQEALRLAQEEKPDVVIMQVQIPSSADPQAGSSGANKYRGEAGKHSRMTAS